MSDIIQPLLNIEQYIKRLNAYLQEHYPANKKITAEEWNALLLALMKQGNLQEETLEKICNDYLPLQINKINTLVDTANDHENRIKALRTDTDEALKDSKYAVETSNDALKRVVQKLGTISYVDGLLMPELSYTSDPQAQLDTLQTYIDTERNARIDSDATLQSQITKMNSKIPTQASNTNQLADKDFVNSSIATATATFKGTFTSLDELKLTVADENDYAYYDHTDLYGNRMFDRYKYSSGSWSYEYTLNNSSFTEEQWKAINSGITKELLEGQFIQYVTLNVPSTAVSGTLTDEQLNLLQSNKENKIILAGEMYEYSDNLTETGLLVYTHTGQDGANHFYIKSISVTLSTKGWARTIYDMQNSKSLAFAESERQKSKNLLPLKGYASSLLTINTGEDGSINITGILYTDESYNILAKPVLLKKGKTYVMHLSHVEYYTNTYDLNICFTMCSAATGEFIEESENFLLQVPFINYWSTLHWTPEEDVYITACTLYNSYTSDVPFEVKGYIQLEEGDTSTEFQPYSGRVIHELDIADVEHCEVIYNKDSSDSSINWGYTDGIISANGFINRDLLKYKKLRCNVRFIPTTTLDVSSGYGSVIVDLEQLMGDSYVGSNTFIAFFETNTLFTFTAKVMVPSSKNGIQFLDVYSAANGSYNNVAIGALTKIEGIY